MASAALLVAQPTRAAAAASQRAAMLRAAAATSQARVLRATAAWAVFQSAGKAASPVTLVPAALR
jgi:hypothetical protein